jgi:hypothetical protein
VPGGIGDLLETMGPVMALAGEDLDGLVDEMNLDPMPSNLISWIQRAPDGTRSIAVASAGSMNQGRAP